MGDSDIRKWLRANNYDDIADAIDEVMQEWKTRATRTRRNWWLILAGGKNGRQLSQAGRKFLVLQSAQLREGKTVTENAICRNDNEVFPPKIEQARWTKRRS